MGEGSVGLSPLEAEKVTLFWFNALLIASNGTGTVIELAQPCPRSGATGSKPGYLNRDRA